MNLLPIWAVFHAWSNSTGHEILLKMGVNSLRLYLYACLIELGIIPMNLLPFWAVFHARSNFKFNRSNSTGHEILLNLGWNSWIYTQFEQYFRPGQIGYHSNEFTPILSSISCPVKFQIRLVEFDQPWNTAQFGEWIVALDVRWFETTRSSRSQLVSTSQQEAFIRSDEDWPRRGEII